MDHFDPVLRGEYERWCREVGDDDPYAGRDTVGIHDVLRAHFLIIQYFWSDGGEAVGGIGPRDLHLLHSALSRQAVGYGGRSKWSDKLLICATLFYGLVLNHAFHDANKRTAFLVALFHLGKIGRVPRTSGKEFEQLALRLAEHTLDQYPAYRDKRSREDAEVRFIADFFRTRTREVDKQIYLVTFSQLDRLLRRFGYYLANPHKNFIDVVHDVVEPTGLFGRGTRTVPKKVTTVGFPGWTDQAGKDTVRHIREKASLTPQNGIDSQVFFRDLDPIESLIPAYHASLVRLARK